MTFLFDKTVFGPVHSRRLGVSLGINLLPTNRKVCSFDCLYCECGSLRSDSKVDDSLPSRNEVAEALRTKLDEMAKDGVLPDTITFAGNGEPTLHPEFALIIDDTLALRDLYAPKAKVAVLSNSTQLHRKDVVDALHKVNDCILKIDAGDETTILMLDQPNSVYSLDSTIDLIKQMGDNLVLQTMFVRWEKEGIEYDNADNRHVMLWLDVLRRIKPKRLMIYTIERDTPLQTMWKTPKERLDEIARLAQDIVPEVSISY